MFSPDATSQGTTSIRNPRRRQRNTSDDSIVLQQTAKRRKRSFIQPDTFEPPNQKSNGTVKHANTAVIPSGNTLESRKQRNVSGDTTSLAIRNRGTKRGEREKRGNKTEDGIVQVQMFTNVYRIMSFSNGRSLD